MMGTLWYLVVNNVINLPPVGCPQDSHRCFLLHVAGQRETVQYLRTRRKMLIGSLPLSTFYFPLFSFSHTHTHSRRRGQIHYNNPRGCHGPHHSADKGQRWTEQRKVSEKKTPEDSPRSEMCFRLHSNTPTVPATRGTKSNKAEREGSREGVVTVTLSTKRGGGEEKREKNTAWIFRDNINVKSVRSMGGRRRGSRVPPTPKIQLQGPSSSLKNDSLKWIWMSGGVEKKTPHTPTLHAFASCFSQSQTRSSVKERTEVQPVRAKSLSTSADAEPRHAQAGRQRPPVWKVDNKKWQIGNRGQITSDHSAKKSCVRKHMSSPHV